MMSRVSYEKTCEHCGGTFTANRMDARFCSKRCDEAYRRSLRPPKVVKCKWCGKEFFSPRGTAKYCSPRCKFKNNNIKQAERAKRRERLLEDVAPEDRAAVEKTFKQLNRHEGMYKKRSESEPLLGISRRNLDDIGNAIFED